MSEPPTVSEVVVTAPAPEGVPSNSIQVYSPQISVLLKKVVNRTATAAEGVDVSERVKATAGGQLELMNYLAEGSEVSVSRTVRGGDSGTFSIVFPDQMNGGQMDTIYGLVEPMDVIEIRMARSVSGAGSAAIPIMLRGFVTGIARQEIMTPKGPRRSVTISGHDYMKILQIMRVIYLPTMIVGQDLLTNFSLYLNYGIDAQNYTTASDFVNEVMSKAINPFIDRIKASSAASGGSSPVVSLGVDATSPASTSNVSPFGTQGWPGGSFYDLLSHFGDVGPWQELYVEDRDEGPVLVYRPTPFKTAAGDYIQDAASAASITVRAQDLLNIDVARDDADLANYFWVDAPRYQLIGSPILQQDQSLQPQPAVTDYQNNDPTLYGIRLLEVATQQGGRYDGQPEPDVDAGDEDALNINNDKRRILIENNKDNVVLEKGAMRLKGNEKIRAGMYVKLDRGGFEAEYYAHQVSHSFVVGQGFITTVQFDRGTGFLERVKRGTGTASAYLAELTVGGVYHGSE